MVHKQPISLAQVRAGFTQSSYLSALRSCADSRTDASTLESTYKHYFIGSQSWSDGMSVDDLSRIMAFKLARGKWRPRLQGLIESNKDDLVRDVTREAASTSNLEDRMKVLCKLAAVGPATASLILTIMDKNVPFYSDELAAFHLGPDIKPKYNLKEYLTIVETHNEWLGREGGTEKDETLGARQAEEMIWLWSRTKSDGSENGDASPTAKSKRSRSTTDAVRKKRKV